MRVTSYNTQNSYSNKNPSFQRVLPEHMFLDVKGFDRDVKWAENAVNIIEKVTNGKNKSFNFQKILDFVAKKYEHYYEQKPINKKTEFIDLIFGKDKFGKYRDDVNHIPVVSVTDDSKYSDYKFRLAGQALYKGSLKDDMKFIMEYMHGYKNEAGETIPLVKIKSRFTKQSPETGYGVSIRAASLENVKPALEETGKIFNKIIKNKNKLTDENMQIITKDIAKIHWLMSQAWPFKRGSAGIADIISKVLFESKGIQVSSYKSGVNPNLEAFVLPLEEYTEAYHTFFSEPLTKIKCD